MTGSRIVAVIGGLILTGALGLAAVVGGRALEMQPAFCASCHEIREHYNRWLASGAAQHSATCIECHSGPGLAGIVGGQLRGARHVVRHVTGRYATPISADVPRSWCVKCHSESTLAARHVRVPDIGPQRCGACHNRGPGACLVG
jgi:NapC/NirT cytochrome c family, N-terminal region